MTDAHGLSPRWWPTDPSLFASTSHCPACFTALTSFVCAHCGLDVSTPGTAELLGVGRAILSHEEQRQSLLQSLRQRQAATGAHAAPAPDPLVSAQPVLAQPAQVQAALAQPAQVQADTTPALAAPVPHAPTMSAHAVSTPMASTPAPLPVDASSASTAPRRSGVQIFLLTVGVILVSITAIFFLFVAYFVATLEWRSIMIGAASVLVLGVAALLNQRALKGTAEGVSVIAIVLLLLDVWIVRANDLFGSAALDGATFTGGGFLILAAALAVFHSVTRLRVASVSAAVLAPIGAALFAGGLAHEADIMLAVWVAFLAAGLTGLAAPKIALTAERLTLAMSSLVALTLATLIAPVVLTEEPWSAFMTLGITGVAWLFHVGMRHSTGNVDVLPYVAAAGTGLSFSLGVVLTVARTVDGELLTWALPTASGVLSLAILALTYGSTSGNRRVLFVAFAASLSVTATTALPALAFGALNYVRLLNPQAFAMGSDLGDTGLVDTGIVDTGIADIGTVGSYVSASLAWAPLAIAMLALLSALALRVLNKYGHMLTLPAALLAAAILSAIGTISSEPLPLVLLALASVAALAALIRWRPLASALRVVLAVFAAFAVLALYGASYSRPALWLVGVAIALAVVVAARVTLSRLMAARSVAVAAPVLTGIASVGIIHSLFFVYPWLTSLPAPLDAVRALRQPLAAFTIADQAFWPAVAGACVLALVAALPSTNARTVDLAVIASAAGLATIVSLVMLTGDTVAVPREVARLVPLAITVTAGLAWLIAPNRTPFPGRAPFAIATPLLGALWAWLLTIDTAVAAQPLVLVALVTVLSATFGLAARHRLAARDRDMWQTTVFALVIVTALVTATMAPDLAWLTLLLLAVTCLIIAATYGDPFASTDSRRHIAWGALPLAIGSLWLALAEHRVELVEAYTLPLAGLLVVITTITTWRRPVASAERMGRGRTTIAISALIVAIVPSLLISARGDELRPVLVIALGAAATAIGLASPAYLRGLHVRLILCVAGTSAAIVAGTIRAVTYVLEPGLAGLEAEAWLAGGVALCVVLAALWPKRTQQHSLLVHAALIPALVGITVVEILAVVSDEHALVRALVAGCLLAAVYVGAIIVAHPPLGTATERAAVTLAVASAIAMLLARTVEPFEVVTVPLAVGLIAGGLVRLDARPSSGTWQHLAPGIAALLVPPLLADFFSPPLWRVVALGIVALAIVLVALARKWQAPLILGGAVLAAHAIAQLWPWIVDVYNATPWWLWLGVGGVALIVIAATYEKRIQNFKSVARSIGSLR